MLRFPQDAWTKVAKKIAGDVVHRLFDYLGKVEESSNKNLTSEMVIDCFLKGKSVIRSLKGIAKQRNPYLGREIKITNENGVSDKLFTSHLFEKPKALLTTDENMWFSPSEGSLISEILQ